MTLSPDEYLKVKDLRIVYGTSELCDYLGVNRGVVETVLSESAADLSTESSRKIRGGIRQYWKSWMGKHRLTSERK